ncbi:MAG TPA: hypothetical protein VIN06_12060 [Devosia sp.]
MSGAAPAKAPRPAEGSTLYDLFIRHRTRAFWKMTDQGVIPEADRLAYPVDGRWGFRLYSDIVSVNLASITVPRFGTTTNCTIKFGNGAVLVVVNSTAQGVPDAGQAEHYYDFVVDLHQRLVDGGHAGRIRFTRGFEASHTHFGAGFLLTGASALLVVPLLIALGTGDPEVLWAMLGGVFFLYPLWRGYYRNQPATYDPRDPPDMLA